jgi:hypothetical protein
MLESRADERELAHAFHVLIFESMQVTRMATEEHHEHDASNSMWNARRKSMSGGRRQKKLRHQQQKRQQQQGCLETTVKKGTVVT